MFQSFRGEATLRAFRGYKNKRLARVDFYTSRRRNPSMDFVCGHLGRERKELISSSSFFLFLPRPEGGFHGSLDSLLSFSVFECTGCQGRLLTLHTHTFHTQRERRGIGIVSQWDSCQIQTIYIYKYKRKRRKKKVTGPDKERSLGCCGCDERP